MSALTGPVVPEGRLGWASENKLTAASQYESIKGQIKKQRKSKWWWWHLISLALIKSNTLFVYHNSRVHRLVQRLIRSPSHHPWLQRRRYQRAISLFFGYCSRHLQVCRSCPIWASLKGTKSLPVNRYISCAGSLCCHQAWPQCTKQHMQWLCMYVRKMGWKDTFR